MPYTVPNQRVVQIHREGVKSDFLGIKNANWQAAARDLGAHSLLLYLYFASNADGFELALSPAAIRQTIGMPAQTYRDQFLRLLDKGYLVQLNGNHYAFYETPQKKKEETDTTAVPDSSQGNTADGVNGAPVVQKAPSQDIEINNTNNNINNNGLLEKQVSPTPKKFIF